MATHVQFEILGEYALLMHRDDVLGADELNRQRKSKDGSNWPRGDDRWPASTWHISLYHDGKHVCLPSSAIMASLCNAAARVNKQTRGSYKKDVLGNVAITEEFCAFYCGLSPDALKQVSMEAIAKLGGCDFEEQARKVEALGFALDVRRAKIGQSKHVRVRPRFEFWRCTGTFTLFDTKKLDKSILVQIADEAGPLGLCDYRPGSPKSPGPFGRFQMKLK